MSNNRLRALLTMTALLTVGSNAIAAPDTSLFSPASVRIMDARKFVTEADGAQFVFRQDLVLTIQNDDAAEAFLESGFQVRVFALDSLGRPREWAYFKPCRVYYSTVIGGAKIKGHQIDLGPLEYLSWLSVAKGQPLASRRFLLVFEQASDKKSFFRLNEADSAAYFARGLRIEVVPIAGFTQAQIDNQANAVSIAMQNAKAGALINSSAHRCYRPTQVAHDQIDDQFASLEVCEAD